MPSSASSCNGVLPDVQLAPLLTDFPPDLFGSTLYRSIRWADSYVFALSLQVLKALGVGETLAAAPVSAAALCRAHGFADGFAPRLSWLLQRVAASGLLTVSDAAGVPLYHRRAAWRDDDAVRLAAEGLATDANRPTMALLQAAAAAWPKVARGEVSGEAVLLGPQAVTLWLDYFHNDNLLYAVNNRVAATVAARALATKPRFAILELGAGAGSATAALIDALADEGLTDRLAGYQVTEPSALFRRRGERMLKERARTLPLRFASLDIDRPWGEQLAESEATFDLIYGVNVLHVAKDLAFSLGEARARIKPGGTLVIGECLRPDPAHGIYIEFVFQLLASFQQVKIDGERRPRPGFLTPEEWQQSLQAAGFTTIAFKPDHWRTREILPQLYVAAVCAG